MKQRKIISIVAVMLVLFSMTFLGGCNVIKQVDPCEREYTQCVHECGEGILSSLCKETCTYDRTQCQET